MAMRIKQQNTVFTNNSQLILGVSNNANSENQNLSQSTNFPQTDQGLLSPIKIPSSIKQLRSQSQNILMDTSPEIVPKLQKVKRARISENGVNIFSDVKAQQSLQQTMVENINGNQSNISQKEQQHSSKKSMSDMLSDWLVNSNTNLTYNDIISKANSGNNNFTNSNVAQQNTANNAMNNPNENIRLSIQTQIQQTPVKKIRKSDNIYSSPTKSMISQEYPQTKNGKSIYEAIEKQIISSQTTKNSQNGSNFIKEQIDQQVASKTRHNAITKFQQQPLLENQNTNGIDTTSSQNTKTIDNLQPSLPNLNGSQAYSVRNSAQKWFHNQQQIGNQIIQAPSGNKLTSNLMNSQSQPNGVTQKQHLNQSNILNSILSHNQQKKLPELINSNVPGKLAGVGDNPPETVNYLRTNQNGLQIPVVKQNSQSTYQSSIGTKPNITLRREKVRYASLIPIESNSSQQQSDNLRDFLGIEKPINEEKQPVIKMNDQNTQQNGSAGGSISVGRFKIRKVTQVPEENINKQIGYYSPYQQQVQSRADAQQQYQNDQQQSISLSHLPSPLPSPTMHHQRNISPQHQSMPSLQINSQDFDLNSSSSENTSNPNNNQNNQNNPINNNNNNNLRGEQVNKASFQRGKVKSDKDINSNKLEMIKLQQAWNFDDTKQNNNSNENDQQQPQQQQQLQQPQQNQKPLTQNQMDQLLSSSPQPNQQIYNGDNFGHFQFIKGATLKSKSILKSKSPDGLLQAKQTEENKNISPDQNNNNNNNINNNEGNRKNFHIVQNNNNNNNNQESNIIQYNKIRGQRKNNSMCNLESQNMINRKKCVNFKETLRVINLYRGTESIERLKKPLTGSVMF